MLFSSPIFLVFFLPAVLLLALSVRRTSLQNAVLLVASLLFYAWGELAYTLILIGSIALNYAMGLWIEGTRGRSEQRGILALAIALNLSILAVFKYANFVVDNLNVVLGVLGIAPLSIDPVHLPIGISFFTFQAMTYVVDVYRRDAAAQRSLFRVALYVALFPQLIAGPIVRYRGIAAQLIERHTSREDIAIGIRRFVMGLGKKILLADQLALTADRIFAVPVASLDPGVAWLGVTCFGLQVYFDFSGYSDMAIGLGRMFGFHFPENFNAPYTSRSLQEFWRRWHISLSGWFRDYLYIPLTAGHNSASRSYASLLLVFLLCGLWHGSNWNFVVWGLVHGLAVALERTAFGGWLGRLRRPLAQGYTLLVVWIAFVFFRANDLGHAIDYLAAMFGLGGAMGSEYPLALFLDFEVCLWLAVAIVFSGAWMPAARGRLLAWGGPLGFAAARVAGLVWVFVGSSISMVAGTHSPFVYFRF